MKKKLLNIISIAVISLSLSGCSLLNDSNNSGNTITDSPLVNKPSIDDPKTDSTKPWLSGKTVKGHNFTSEITIEECDEIAKEMKQAKEYALEDSHYDYFYDVYSKLENIYYKVNDAEDIEFLEYSVYGNTTNLDNSEEFSSVKTDILQWYNEVEHIAYKNSFKEKLWEGKTDEEILKIIGEEFPDEYYELKKKMTSLENDFNVLSTSDYNFLTKADKIFVQYVETSNKFAKYLDFNNYMEYSYIYDYERDYNPTDTNDFFKYVVEYLVPYSSKLQTKLSDDEKKLTRQEKRLAEDYFKSDAFTSDKFSVIENYKNHMGGIIEEAFDNLFKEDGCYFISYDNDSFDSAYQSSIGGTPYVFYGSSYHDYSTVVHEFGHYTYDLLGNSLQSFDLCETHSQANEVLFLNYYINNQDISTNLKTYLRDYKIADFIESVILCSLVNETEKRCYNSENLKTGDLEKYLRKIYSENRSLMTAYDFDNALYYIAYVSMSSPCYYISYATSQLGSLNIEKLAYNDFDKAKDSYLKLFNYENCNTYREVYEYAGLYDPLSEDMFKYIVS